MPERYLGLVCLCLLLLLIVVFNHIPENKEVVRQQRYDIGDIVYLKLDNNKGQIVSYNEVYNYYNVRFLTSGGYQTLSCEEKELVEIVEKK